MGILIVADSAEDLPEGLRASAKQTENGKYQVTSLPEGWGLENIKGLVKSLGSERGARKLLSDKLAEFGWKLSEAGDKWTAEGLNHEEARKAVEAMQSGTIKTNKDLDALKAQLAQAAEAREKGLLAERDALFAELSERVTSDAALALTKHGANPESLELLVSLAKQRTKVEKGPNGKHRAVIVGDDGERLYSTKSGAAGADMSFDEWAEKLRGTPGFKPLFQAKQAGGSGSSSQSGGTGRVVDQGSAKLSARGLIQRANEQSTPAGAAG